ncbi:hypothetical protein K0M31_009432 [Melipona bicolor]|uniref:Uncharacterized protein n=1 Tax=Melipona bicolor TaxID=60889 RepID=A0AA40FN27_9HYME|nr:hypothetical protein K0M31_009432 [Melipona bicolor]
MISERDTAKETEEEEEEEEEEEKKERAKRNRDEWKKARVAIIEARQKVKEQCGAKSEKKKVEEVRTDGETTGRDRKNCLRKCHVWPCWNAVKTDGANRARKTVTHPWQPSGRWVTFGPGSAVLAYACTLLRQAYMHANVRTHICRFMEDSLHVFASNVSIRVRDARAPAKGEKNSRNASTGIILLRERLRSKFYKRRRDRKMRKLASRCC